MLEFICPSCDVKLDKRRFERGVYWACPLCKGRSSTISLMRRSVPHHIVNEIWQGVRNVDYPEIRDCPCCPAMMEQIPVNVPDGQVLIDVCPRCQFIWFDADERGRLPEYIEPAPRKKKQRKMSNIALARSFVDGTEDSPDELWKYIPALLGMPVELDSDSDPVNAWVTWALALAIAVVGMLSFRSLSEYVGAYGLVPAQAMRQGGITLITSFFLHGGPLHLLSNLYFLLNFGDNVEAVLGRFKFLMLILLATVVGSAAHVLMDPSSTVPCVGASGGISGLLAFYAIAFPGTRLAVFLFTFLKVGWARMPAVLFFAFWVMLQVWGAVQQAEGVGSVSYAAHLGGVAIGVVFGVVWRVSRSFMPEHEPVF